MPVKVAGAWHIRVCFLELPGIPCAHPPPSIFDLWLVEPEDVEAADTEGLL